MNTNITHEQISSIPARNEKFNWFEKYALLRSHPRKLFIDSAGIIWAVYFLWGQNWLAALLIYAGTLAFSLISVWEKDVSNLYKTTLGRIALLHLHPANFILQVMGMIPLVYGIWAHSTEYILVGFSTVLVGHSFGWSRVSENFKIK